MNFSIELHSQGPLDLFNVDEERVGNMTLYNTRFQPFWKRAKGEWGQDDHCLPKAIQIMREDVVPFVTSGAFFSFVLLLIGGYGLYRNSATSNNNSVSSTIVQKN